MIKYDPEKNPYDGTYVSPKDGGNPEYGFHQVWKEGYEQALRDVEKQVKQFSGWICPNCGPLDGCEVTYKETCERCGYGVK